MELGDLKQLRDLYHLEVVAAVACEGRPGAFLVAVVVAVIGVVVVVIAAACWAYIDIQTYIWVAVERGTHSSPSAQWSYPIGTDWATVVQTPCRISPIFLGVFWWRTCTWCIAQFSSARVVHLARARFSATHPPFVVL